MSEKAIQKINNLEKIAAVLDSRFTVPGTRFRFGLDPIIGLIPIAGDVISATISSALVVLMWQHGASNKLIVKMALNILIDTVIGSIPFAGSVFDFFFRANNKNIRLLREYHTKGKHRGSAKGLLIGILLLVLAVMTVIVYLVWQLVAWVFSYL